MPPWEKGILLYCRRGFLPSNWIGKESACSVGDQGLIPKWQPTPELLPEESHRQRSLVGYSPWGHKESDKITVQKDTCTTLSIAALFTIAKILDSDIRWIIEKASEFQKNIYLCFIDYTEAFDCGSQQTVENS